MSIAFLFARTYRPSTWNIRQILSEWFGRSVIRSCAQFSYDHAQSFIDDPDRDFASTPPEDNEFPAIDGGHSIAAVREKVLDLHKVGDDRRAISANHYFFGSRNLCETTCFEKPWLVMTASRQEMAKETVLLSSWTEYSNTVTISVIKTLVTLCVDKIPIRYTCRFANFPSKRQKMRIWVINQICLGNILAVCTRLHKRKIERITLQVFFCLRVLFTCIGCKRFFCVFDPPTIPVFLRCRSHRTCAGSEWLTGRSDSTRSDSPTRLMRNLACPTAASHTSTRRATS